MAMQTNVVEIGIKGVMPTSNGCAIFLGSDLKTFVIYMDQNIGNAISMAIKEVKKERPLTHDLLQNVFEGFGVTLERIVINGVDDGTFYARIILKMENEIGTKIVEIDARPSDSIVLALQNKSPMYVAQEVLDSVEDVSEILSRLLNQQG